MAFSSAVTLPGAAASSPSCKSAILPSCNSFLATMSLRIANRMRRVGRPRAFVHADRPEAARLEYPDQFQPNHLEKRETCDDEAVAIVGVGKELFESARR